MKQPRLNIWRIITRKLAVAALILSSGLAAYATLGDGKSTRSDAPKKSLLNNRTTVSTGHFSLRSGYNFRGSSVINNAAEKKYISLNTTVTVQKGNTTYILPMKKKILENVKVDFSNRQLRRN
ncbi:MAG: hypothetical protein IPP93_07050 [Chitinophagaceae bacterium]|nr:hypothetical protein [Chitinophagaceae bacterium]MBL0335024.1 hypothetical protein [Chitinophagaceae bacterium]